jgi:hypothetical protein
MQEILNFTPRAEPIVQVLEQERKAHGEQSTNSGAQSNLADKRD